VSFQRRRIAKGSEVVVTFTIVPDDHAVMRQEDYAYVVEPGALLVLCP
jgi:hypothetical protein